MICDNCKKDQLRGGAAGQAFTDWECQICKRKFIHHNTAVPKVCPECSNLHKVCEICGSTIN